MRPGRKELLLYFLRLGALGFGGPIALAGAMKRELVDEKRWVTEDEYREGLTLAQLAPGPLAAQLAIYLGWVKFGVLGATLVAVAFVAPSFLMVVGLSAAYVRFGGLPWMQGAFYGIGAAVIAVISRSAWKLVRGTLGGGRLCWVLCAGSAVVTALTETETVWLFLLSGLVAMVWRRFAGRPIGLAMAIPAWWLTGLQGPAPAGALATIFLYFAEAGTFVFGSGLAIVPFLHSGVVSQFGWLTERQFLDAVAVAMITPGPVVITVAFIGYLVGGPAGAILAALGVFLPCYLMVVIPAPHFRRYSQNQTIKAFVDGVTASAIGAICGAVFVLGKRAISDVQTALIALIAYVVLWRFRRIPEPLLIVAAGAIGSYLSSIV